MRSIFQPLAVAVTVSALIAIAGCSSTASQSSPESGRDPLGIDRAVDDYYFPDGETEAAGDAESISGAAAAVDSVDSTEKDNLP